MVCVYITFNRWWLNIFHNVEIHQHVFPVICYRKRNEECKTNLAIPYPLPSFQDSLYITVMFEISSFCIGQGKVCFMNTIHDCISKMNLISRCLFQKYKKKKINVSKIVKRSLDRRRGRVVRAIWLWCRKSLESRRTEVWSSDV